MAYKGLFRPKNPKKYRGDPTNIIYRSRWELKFMMYLDDHPKIMEWSSEEFFIPYIHPLDKKYHRYFPDFWIKKENADGSREILVVEIKPLKQTKEPEKPKKVSKRFINEALTYSINDAKWKAAEQFCADRKWRFMIMTEKELGIKF